MEFFQSRELLFEGAPAFLTLPFAVIAGGALIVLILLVWIIAAIAGRSRRLREEEQLEALYDIEDETPSARPITPMPAPQPPAETYDEVLPSSPPVPEPLEEPELAALAPEPDPEPVAEVEPEPEPVVEAVPEPVVEAAPEPVVEPEPEPVIEAAPLVEAEPEVAAEPEPEPAIEAEPAAPESEPEPEPIAAAPLPLEGAPAREPEPAPLEEAPNPAAEPVDASPAGIEEAITEPVTVASFEAPTTVEASAELAPEPVPEAAVEPEAPAVAPAPEPAPAAPAFDDLTRMKGVGPRLAERLNTVGITSFAQIAALSPEAAATLDSKLGDFQGRLDRDRWIEQAQLLAGGDIAAFEEKFGKL